MAELPTGQPAVSNVSTGLEIQERHRGHGNVTTVGISVFPIQICVNIVHVKIDELVPVRGEVE